MVYLVLAKKITPPEVAGLRSALQAYQVRITPPSLVGVWEDGQRAERDAIERIAQARMDTYLSRRPGEDVEIEDFMPAWYEVEFSFDDVSAARLGWAEYLLSIYCRLAYWKLAKVRHPQAYADGNLYADRHGQMPPALGYPMRSRLARFIRPSRKKRNKKRRRRRWLQRLFD